MGTSPSALCMPSMISSYRPGLERTSAVSSVAQRRSQRDHKHLGDELVLHLKRQQEAVENNDTTSGTAKHGHRGRKFVQLRCHRVKVVGIGRGCHDELGSATELGEQAPPPVDSSVKLVFELRCTWLT